MQAECIILMPLDIQFSVLNGFIRSFHHLLCLNPTQLSLRLLDLFLCREMPQWTIRGKYKFQVNLTLQISISDGEEVQLYALFGQTSTLENIRSEMIRPVKIRSATLGSNRPPTRRRSSLNLTSHLLTIKLTYW